MAKFTNICPTCGIDSEEVNKLRVQNKDMTEMSHMLKLTLCLALCVDTSIDEMRDAARAVNMTESCYIARRDINGRRLFIDKLRQRFNYRDIAS